MVCCMYYRCCCRKCPVPLKKKSSTASTMVRCKSRYLLCEVNVANRNSLLLLREGAVVHALREAVARAHGDYGAAHCNIGFSVKYLNALTGMIFIRCLKSCYRLIWSALPFITSIESRGQKVTCFLNCLHVGGTIRTCQKFLIRHNTKQLHRMLPQCKSEGERQEIRKAILNTTNLSYKKSEEASDDEVESDGE